MSDTKTYYCSPLMFQRKHCNANFFLKERLTNSSITNPRFSLCCGDGKVKLWTIQDLPLATLLVDTSSRCRQFQRDIRRYNCALCPACLQVTLPNGTSVFKVQGEVYRFIGAMRHTAVSLYEHAMRVFHFCACEHAILLLNTHFGPVHHVAVNFITNCCIWKYR